jgi:hypothetical protein
MVDSLAKEVEKEKMTAIGARNLLKSVAKQREAERQQLQVGRTQTNENDCVSHVNVLGQDYYNCPFNSIKQCFYIKTVTHRTFSIVMILVKET